MGVGTNRMNTYTVGMATQGYANYLKKCFKDVKVAIAHDCRNNSRKFAEITANIFAANGIKVFLFESLRPTPELSFAIRTFAARAVWCVLLLIIQKNIMAIKLIGMMAHKWYRLMMKIRSKKLKRLKVLTM